MSDAAPVPPAQDQLLQEAAMWFARMRGPDAEASRAEFEAWLKRGAVHRQAYNRASEIFAMGKLLAESPEPPPAAPRPARPGRGRAGFALAIGVLLAALAASWLALRHTGAGEDGRLTVAGHGTPPPAQILETGPDRPQTIRLADGSIVRLAPGSLLEVRLGPVERRLDLRRGAGRFQVHHEVRPFSVHAGGGQVVARGTIFDVGYGGDRRVTVHLIEGVVDVTLPSRTASPAPSLPPRRLHPGQSLAFEAAAPAAISVRPARSAQRRGPGPGLPEAGTGARDFDAMPLSRLVATANEGAPRPIRLADDALGRRRVSGRFRTDDTMLLAQRLATLFGLAVDARRDEIILRAR